MSLSWSFEVTGEALVVNLAGYLGEDSVDRFDGFLGWVLAQKPGVLVVDTSGLSGWSTEGHGAVADAVRLIRERGTRVCLCAPPDVLSESAGLPDAAGVTGVYPDVASALAALERRSARP